MGGEGIVEVDDCGFVGKIVRKSEGMKGVKGEKGRKVKVGV